MLETEDNGRGSDLGVSDPQLRAESLSRGLTPERLGERARMLDTIRKYISEYAKASVLNTIREAASRLDGDRPGSASAEVRALEEVRRMRSGSYLETMRSAIAEAKGRVPRLRQALANALKRRGIADPEFGLRSGDLDPSRLASGACGLTDRFFSHDSSTPGDAELRIVLCIDNSGSMSPKLKAAAAAYATIGEALNGLPNVRFASLGFSIVAIPAKGFGTAWSDIDRCTRAVGAVGGTAGTPALAMALTMLRRERKRGGREAIFIVTDGEVCDGAETVHCIDLCRAEGVEIFGIGLESTAILGILEPQYCAIGTASSLDAILSDMVSKLITRKDI